MSGLFLLDARTRRMVETKMSQHGILLNQLDQFLAQKPTVCVLQMFS